MSTSIRQKQDTFQRKVPCFFSRLIWEKTSAAKRAGMPHIGWLTGQKRLGLVVGENGRTLLDHGSHAFLLVVGVEQKGELGGLSGLACGNGLNGRPC